MCTLYKAHVFCVHIRSWTFFWKGFAVFFSLLGQPKILVCRFSYCFGHMHMWINFSKQNHRISPALRGHLEGQNTAHFPRYHRYSPGPWGAVVAIDWCIIWNYIAYEFIPFFTFLVRFVNQINMSRDNLTWWVVSKMVAVVSILFAFAIGLFTYWVYTLEKIRRKYDKLGGPRSIPILGNAHQLKRDPSG